MLLLWVCWSMYIGGEETRDVFFFFLVVVEVQRVLFFSLVAAKYKDVDWQGPRCVHAEEIAIASPRGSCSYQQHYVYCRRAEGAHPSTPTATLDTYSQFLTDFSSCLPRRHKNARANG